MCNYTYVNITRSLAHVYLQAFHPTSYKGGGRYIIIYTNETMVGGVCIDYTTMNMQPRNKRNSLD